ncbi:MAG: fumarylacetoacetate hydrolase family protein [Planctomycetia bacterium]|nr:fumarylacetoacetate hydrolase family protein [Planctomycetia bacterium]
MRLAICHGENLTTIPVMITSTESGIGACTGTKDSPVSMVDIRSVFPDHEVAPIRSLRAILPELCDPERRARLERMFRESESIEQIRSTFRPGPPVSDPPKILCVGLNYRDHAQECGQTVPDRPVWFNKLPTSLCGPDDPVRIPPVVQFADYEAELVVVIGRGGRNIPISEAMSYVAGYTCGNDVTARDWQFGRPGGQWFAGKTFDTFAPIGPVLVTPDELDPTRLSIECRVNGERRQDSSTSQFIFPIDFLIHEISQVCTLEPGDLIWTGTPPGIGYARTPPVPLRMGDIVEIEIGGIGVLRNPVCAPA